MADPIHQSPVTSHFAKLCDIVAKLRAPGGCPWDAEQTNETLLPPLIEEAYEVAGAVPPRGGAKPRGENRGPILSAPPPPEKTKETRGVSFSAGGGGGRREHIPR